MIKLEAGNVLLKPSHRRQIMTWLKRALRLGQRLGHFAMTITLTRIGKTFEVKATVRNAAGAFACRIRQSNFLGAMREMAGEISMRLHDQWVRGAAA